MRGAQMETSAQRYTSLKAFYPYYLSEHANLTCRRLHFVGTSLVVVFVGLAIFKQNPNWLFAALLSGYGFAWIGHFFFEHNRPATFKYPLYSFVSDWIMYAEIWAGKVKVR